MMGLSTTHIVLVCLIVFLLFGRTLFSDTMSDLAKGLKQLKDINREDKPTS